MTARNPQATKREYTPSLPLPDPPEREPEDTNSFHHLARNGNVHHLVQHFANPETTLVAGERYITREPGAPAEERMVPDLLITFNAHPQAYRDDNGYVISRQGKPPDFVMEIAAQNTGQEDVGEKRTGYESLGIPEYWRFDETGEFHGTRLAGDRLVRGRYEPVPIEALEEGILQGYSAVLDLFIRWEHGELRWHDPATGQHIITLSDLLARAERERALTDTERSRANAEQEARMTAEARVRELEEELRQRETQD